MPTWPSPRSEQLGAPTDPAIRFTRGTYFGASRFAYATACQVARPPLTDQTGSPQPQEAFTSRLPTGRSPFLPLDITTTGPELLCGRDLHPQEWQLASLHQTRTCSFSASGSSVVLASAQTTPRRLFAIARSEVRLHAPARHCPVQVSFTGYVLPSGPSPCAWLSHAQSTMPDKTPQPHLAGFPFDSTPLPTWLAVRCSRLGSSLTLSPGFPFRAS
jgi:hypothetical protein